MRFWLKKIVKTVAKGYQKKRIKRGRNLQKIVAVANDISLIVCCVGEICEKWRVAVICNKLCRQTVYKHQKKWYTTIAKLISCVKCYV